MKTGKFLLTAFASLALSTAAYAGDIKVSNWVAQTPVGGEAIYVNEIGTTGAPGDWFFTKIAQDETPTMAFSKENDYKLIRMSISKDETGTILYSHDENGNVCAQQEARITKLQDGTCYISYSYPTGKVNWGIPEYVSKTVWVAFISQAQYEYHVAAQKAADLLNESEYTGSTYSQLVAASETTGKDWANQTAAIATLQEQYVADKEAVEKAIAGLPTEDEPILLGTLGGKESYTFDLSGVNPDEVKITVGDDNNPNPNFKIEGSKVTFAPIYGWSYGFANAYVDDINVNVKGIETTIPVIGFNPGLSWREEWQYTMEGSAFRYKPFREPGVYPGDEDPKLRFYAAGYQGLYKNPEFEVVYPNDAAKNAFDVEITKVDNEDPGFRANYAFEAYDVKVTFKDDAKIGSNSCNITIREKNYGQELKLYVEAVKTSIEITTEQGYPLSEYSFSKNGGTRRIGVKYDGFESQDDDMRLSVECDEDSPFSAKFVETGNTLSQYLHGSGLIYIDVTCDAENADEEEWAEFVESALKVRLYGYETSDEITLRRYNAPKLSYADDEEKHEITLGGEVFDTHIDFNADGFGSIYSKDDIKIFTNCDVFVVGNMISWNKDGNRATISLKYDPTHAGVEMKGILYIMYNDQMLTYDLIGLAVSQAKIDELHGISTGIENIEAEGAAQNGVMFNVAGQRVNGSAKGLVIKNGKKYIVK